MVGGGIGYNVCGWAAIAELHVCMHVSECGSSMKICDIATCLTFLSPETIRCLLLSELDVVI